MSAAGDEDEIFEDDGCSCGEPQDECGCYGEDPDCMSCGGTGYCIPYHCCSCGGNEYTCICCPSCGRQDIGRCPCTLTVQKADGGTLELPGTEEGT